MHEIRIQGDACARTFTFPAAWDEITPEQLRIIACVLAATSENGVIRPLLLEQLAAIPPEWMALIEAEDVTFFEPPSRPAYSFEPPTPGKAVLLPQLDWCFQQPVNSKSLLPKFTLEGTEWEGPEDRLFNFTLARFAYCDSILSALASNPDEKLINGLVAALYAPKGYQWENIPHEIKENDLRAKRIAALPQETKLAAILNYRALRGHLAKTYWRVFEGGDDEPLDAGLFGTIYDVCASGIFGDMDGTEQQPLFRVMGYMQHQLQKDERQEQKLKSTKH